MNCELNDIAPFCGSSLGGLRHIGLIDPSDVNGAIRQFCTPSIPEIVLQAGKRVFSVTPTFTAASFTERTVVGQRGGDYFETTVAFSVRGLRLEADALAEKLKNRRIHIVVTDNQNARRVVVNARASVETTTGERRSERSGYRFTFTARRAKKSPQLLGFITSGTVDLTGMHHIFFRDVSGIWRHLTTDPNGTLVTTPADPNTYNNVLLIAPPFGISNDTLGALITP